MPDGYKPARPFLDETQRDCFQGFFCDVCDKGFGCKTQKLVDGEKWPVGEIVAMDGLDRYVCLDFFSENPRLQAKYEEAVPQLYLGFELKNLEDGYIAFDAKGHVVLRCGSKENLERMLLVINSDSVRGRFVAITGEDTIAEV